MESQTAFENGMTSEQNALDESVPAADPSPPLENLAPADLEAWQREPHYDPRQWLEPWPRRRDEGKALRERVPRESHAMWQPPAGRPDPLEIIANTNEGRLPRYVPIRMQRMAASPFGFFRGAAAVMAWDLSRTPVSGLHVVMNRKSTR